MKGDRLILLTGSAGSGKSGTAEALGGIDDRSWTTLGSRLDRRHTATTARQLGGQLDLPASPVLTLAQAAQGGDALLVIDQLDAVSIVRAAGGAVRRGR